jgi:hypothetical protein
LPYEWFAAAQRVAELDRGAKPALEPICDGFASRNIGVRLQATIALWRISGPLTKVLETVRIR